MADGKREHDYDIAIATACFVNRTFMSSNFRPEESNPYRINRVKPDTKGGFELMGAALGHMVGARGK